MFKNLKKEQVISELGNVAAVAVGMIAGNIIANAGDKALKVDDTTTGVKKFITGGVCAAGGAVGAVMLKDKKAKLVSGGIGASGVLRVAKKAFPKVGVLQGLGEPDETIGLSPVNAQIASWRYQPSEQSYRPNLPDLGVGMIMPPASSDGYYVDASTNEAALRGYDDNMQGVEDAIIL